MTLVTESICQDGGVAFRSDLFSVGLGFFCDTMVVVFSFRLSFRLVYSQNREYQLAPLKTIDIFKFLNNSNIACKGEKYGIHSC